MEWRKDTSGKTGKIQIKPGVPLKYYTNVNFLLEKCYIRC